MQGKKKADWLALCEEVAVEQDPKKVRKLIAEITRILTEKQDRLDKTGRKGDISASLC